MNRVVLIVLVFIIIAVWFSAFANACAPRGYAGGWGPSWSPPIFIGGGGGSSGGRSGGSSTPSSPSGGRSSGGSSTRGGGISGGSGGK